MADDDDGDDDDGDRGTVKGTAHWTVVELHVSPRGQPLCRSRADGSMEM